MNEFKNPFDGQTFAAVPNLKMVVAEIQPVTIDQPEHGILGTKSNHKGTKIQPVTIGQPDHAILGTKSDRKGKEKMKTKNMVFPDQKMRKGKKQKDEKSFILPKCLKSFESCVEDVSDLPMDDEVEGRELGRLMYL